MLLSLLCYGFCQQLTMCFSFPRGISIMIEYTVTVNHLALKVLILTQKHQFTNQLHYNFFCINKVKCVKILWSRIE